MMFPTNPTREGGGKIGKRGKKRVNVGRKQTDNQDSGSRIGRGKAMNAAKVTLVSTVLAATLGLVAAPAGAHDCARHAKQGHKHCDGGGDPPAAVDPIVVFRIQGDVDRLAVADLDGNYAVVLRSEQFAVIKPKWMPNGRDIVFASYWGGVEGYYRLRIVEDAGAPITDGVPELILEADIGIASQSAVADLGTGDLLLAYPEIIPGPQPIDTDIFVARLNADGTVAKDNAGNPIVANITETLSVSEGWPTLSPDGSSVAYITGVGAGVLDVVVADLLLDATGTPFAGSEMSLVQGPANSPLREANAGITLYIDYSNGTDELVVGASPQDSDRDLWVIPVFSPEDAYPLATTPDIAEIRPSWSSDDSQVIYQRFGDPPCAKRKGSFRWGWRLAIRNVDGILIEGCAEKAILSFGDNPDWRPPAN